MEFIPMTDLKSQYFLLKEEIDYTLQECLQRGDYIKGKQVAIFEQKLSTYCGVENAISCGNGTDALLLAIMSLSLPKGSKIIVPAFTYIAPVEVVKFLGYEVVFCDVDIKDFNTRLEHIESVFTTDVKAIIVVHLFGQPCEDIDLIDAFCRDKNIALIEDNAQSLGAEKQNKRKSIITTSFYPTKNLGAMGDGGAVLCNDKKIAALIRKMASHGQSKKYIHDIIGINSRLDTIQAAILLVKLNYVDAYNLKRRNNAVFYAEQLKNIAEIVLPKIPQNHIFHQYTIVVKNNKRDKLQTFLKEKQVETIVNYPLPVYQQEAYFQNIKLPNTEYLCNSVLSIPIYPEITSEQLIYICNSIKEFFA